MSKLINEYLKQEHIKEQKQREYEPWNKCSN